MAKRGPKPRTPAGRAKIETIEKCMVSCTRCGSRPRVEFDPATDKLEAACPECGFRIRYFGYMCDSSVYEVWNHEAREFKKRNV